MNGALKAIISADASPMRRELIEVERMSKQFSGNISRNMAGSGARANSGSIYETFVLVRELSRKNFGRMIGSSSILAQRMGFLGLMFKGASAEARALALTQKGLAASAMLSADNARILAEQNLRAAAAEQFSEYCDREKNEAEIQVTAAKYISAEASHAKAAASYEEAKASEAATAATRTSLSALGWSVVSLAAVGATAYFVIKHFVTLEKEEKNLSEIMNTATIDFSEQADAMKKSAEEAQGFKDWLDGLSASQESLADSTADALKAMREQAKFEKELAQEKGATKKELAAMDINEAQKELDFMERQKLMLGRKLEQDKIDAKKSADDANDPAREARISSLGKHAGSMMGIVKAIQEKMKSEWFYDGVDVAASKASAAGGGGPVYKTRAANENDLMQVTVDGKEFSMSLNQATAAFKKLTDEENKLAADQKRLSDLAKKGKAMTEKDQSEYSRLTKETHELSADLALKRKFLPEIADGAHGKSVHGHVNSLQQIGAYTVGASDIKDIQKGIFHHVASIDRHVSKGGKGEVGGGVAHVNYGDHH